ncbi:MAG: threonine/serine dehydratase [Gemmatimonadaceae bacterium]
MLRLSDIHAARERIAGRVRITPTLSATRLGDRVGVSLFLKCENLQKTGSFKVRGVLNRLIQLDDRERAAGVITFSAGNHAQALAWAARAAGVHAVVVMSNVAVAGKVAASRGYGAEVVQHGANGLEALHRAREIEAERGLTFVHPFDDEEVVAGAGTVSLELMEQAPDLDVVVVPIGGGGLISGQLVALKETNPKIRVYGVEPTGAAAMRRSLDEGHAIQLESVNTIADGLAAPMAGNINYDIVRRYVDDVVLIDDEAIRTATLDLLFSAKLLAEPAGATATAAILSGAIPLRSGERVAAIVSGGNADEAKLRTVMGAAENG